MLSRPYYLDLIMTNKYLEKIASLGQLAGTVLGSAGRVVTKGVKAISNQVHLASGGAYRDHAAQHLGVTDALKLSKISGSQGGVKEFARSYQRSVPSGQFSAKELRKNTSQYLNKHVPDLKKTQTDARMVVGATAATGTAGVYKLKKKMDGEDNVQTYNY